MVTQADGYAEREAAKVMIKDARQAADDPDTEITLGADKGYDAAEFIKACQGHEVTPHVAQNTSGRRSAVPDAIAASEGYARFPAKAQAHRTGLRLGQDGRRYAPGDGARLKEGRPDVRADDGRLQPRAHALVGTNPSAVAVITR